MTRSKTKFGQAWARYRRWHKAKNDKRQSKLENSQGQGQLQEQGKGVQNNSYRRWIRIQPCEILRLSFSEGTQKTYELQGQRLLGTLVFTGLAFTEKFVLVSVQHIGLDNSTRTVVPKMLLPISVIQSRAVQWIVNQINYVLKNANNSPASASTDMSQETGKDNESRSG